MKENNKLERRVKAFYKFTKRIKNYGFSLSDDTNLHVFKTTGKPCSCYKCRGIKYRDERHIKTHEIKKLINDFITDK